MDRILEPEVMDTWEESIAYDAMDFADVNTAFANDAIAIFTEKLGIKPRPYRTAFLVLLKSGKVINHLKNLATER
jgi:hypothetical protein